MSTRKKALVLMTELFVSAAIKRKIKDFKKARWWKVLPLVAVLVLAMGPSVSAAEQKLKPSTFYFVQMADPQLDTADSKVIEYCERAVQQINALEPQPALGVICGDLIDPFPDVEKDGVNPGRKAWDEFVRIINTFKMPVYCGLGNHDIHSGGKFVQYVKLFKDELFPMLKTRTPSDYFTLRYGTAVFIFLNANRFLHLRGGTEEDAQQHVDWLEAELKKANARGYKQSFLIFHYPLYLQSPDEPSSEKNYSHVHLKWREQILSLCEKYQVTAVLTGHSHRTFDYKHGKTELLTNGSIMPKHGAGPRGYRPIVVTPEGIEHKFIDMDKPAEAKEFLEKFAEKLQAQPKGEIKVDVPRGD